MTNDSSSEGSQILVEQLRKHEEKLDKELLAKNQELIGQSRQSYLFDNLEANYTWHWDDHVVIILVCISFFSACVSLVLITQFILNVIFI